MSKAVRLMLKTALTAIAVMGLATGTFAQGPWNVGGCIIDNGRWIDYCDPTGDVVATVSEDANREIVLTISGIGRVQSVRDEDGNFDYFYYDNYDNLGNFFQPWGQNLHSQINKVVIEDGVTSVGFGPFVEMANLMTVTIGNSVTTIDRNAFSSCPKLSSVTIGNSVITIGESAFAYCQSLKSITIPNSVREIGRDAFQSTGLTSIVIPEGVETLSPNAFANTSLTDLTIGMNRIPYNSGWKKLTSVTMLNSVTAIGDTAFKSCSTLTSVTIPEGVSTIGNNAFARSGLKSITIPDNVTYLGSSTFSGCKSLNSVTIGNGVTTINNAFTGSGIKSITIPDNITYICFNEFAGCDSLNSVTIGNGVTTINSFAFSCVNLKTVTLGSSVDSIATNAFYVPLLKSIIIHNPVPPPFQIGESLSGITPANITLYVPEESVEAYGAARVWRDFGSIKSVDEYASVSYRSPSSAPRSSLVSVRGRTLSVNGGSGARVQVRAVTLAGRTAARFNVVGDARLSLKGLPSGAYLIEAKRATDGHRTTQSVLLR